jgi:hypothetical protein
MFSYSFYRQTDGRDSEKKKNSQKKEEEGKTEPGKVIKFVLKLALES